MYHRHRNTLALALVLAASLLLVAHNAPAQVNNGNNNNNNVGSAGGVYIDAQGVIQYREAAAKDLEQFRARARNAANVKDEKLTFISLPKLFAQAKSAIDTGAALPQAVRYLQGLTQLRYVFVYPQEKDLIIAGPAEDIDAANPMSPVGTRTGRPIMQLDDLVVALRTQFQYQGHTPIGCSIDPPADSLERSGKVMRDFANASRAVRMEEMRKALGPQKVTAFGAAENTRLAFACIAADVKLKRLSLGIDTPPVADLGCAQDNTRPAGSRVWFELDYDPMLVTADGDSFEIRGQRLCLKAGELSFDPKGATEGAKNFAKRFTSKMNQIATNEPLFAELQNIADETFLATLIQHDNLDAKAGWDLNWILDSAKGYPVANVPVSHTAQTLVCFTNGSICAGGVMFTTSPLMEKAMRQLDEKNEIAPIRARAGYKVQASAPDAPNAFLFVEPKHEVVANKDVMEVVLEKFGQPQTVVIPAKVAANGRSEPDPAMVSAIGAFKPHQIVLAEIKTVNGTATLVSIEAYDAGKPVAGK